LNFDIVEIIVDEDITPQYTGDAV